VSKNVVEFIGQITDISVDDNKVAIEITERPVAVEVAFTGPQGPRGEQGIQGEQGVQGDAATISVGTVTTSDPGSSAEVTNSGTTGAAILDFVLPRGEQGPQGIPGEVQFVDLSYVHTQSIASDTWTITHGLQFIPNITVVDSGGTVVEGSYNYPDANTAVLSFSHPFSGKAYLS
jgi:hypothetical protein